MMYELYIEKQRADINQTLSIQLSFAIDDIRQYGTRNTSFTKSITLPGTARNNKLFGHILTATGANPYSINSPNIDVNFNPADISLCEIRMNGLLVLKGIFRLTGYKLNNGVYEYEGNVFGELGGFVSAIGNSRLEDLDFSAYDHNYSFLNVVASWDTINGSGYYYPLIDYGTFSTNKVSYQLKTFRPAFFVKEYIDKIFTASGYTYECDFFQTSFFKSLIIPYNRQRLTRLDDTQFYGTFIGEEITSGGSLITLNPVTLGNFTAVDADTIQYNASSSVVAFVDVRLIYDFDSDSLVELSVLKNGAEIGSTVFSRGNGAIVDLFLSNITISTNDTIEIKVDPIGIVLESVFVTAGFLNITTEVPQVVALNSGDSLIANDTIPRGVFQKDFFSWILRMFNLYVNEDKLKEKHLIIKPYVDYYNYADRLDWSQKIDYSKTLDFTPMGQLNGRFFDYKYKSDNDFYNEAYQKRYNQSYGDILYDTGFPFSKEKQTVEIGFSPTPLIQYAGTDKIVSAIYKKSSGNDIDQEELTDSNIRILVAKKMTGVSSWDILNDVTVLSSQTTYGYGGHLDDPITPTKDLNFGAPSEIFFTVDTYTGNGLFNVYWNSYVQEITNKDSKILSCYVYLDSSDIADLDFSKPIYISGSLWRINKIEDYDATNPVTRVELLKIINADNG